MTNRPVVQIDYFLTFEGEALFNPESDRLECSYVRLPSAAAASLRTVGGVVMGGRRVRTVVRRGLTGSASAEPKGGSRVTIHARAAIVLIAIGALASGCTDAGAVTRTTKAASKTKTTLKRKTSTRPTPKRVTATVATTTRPSTTTPKLSAEAQAVLSGYEAYLVVFAASAREPERAEAILPPGVTGDALARLIDIARYDVSQGQYWDGKRADIISKPRVQSIGESRATIRDCRQVGGVLRKRATNEVVSGSTEPDVDDLIVDFVKIDGRWVVTRTDRTNTVEGKSTCVAASSP